MLAQLAGLADGVHHLAQQVLVGQILRRRGRGSAPRYSALNSSISAAAIFLNSWLIASPDSSCSVSTRIVFGRGASAVLVVAEQRQRAGHEDRRAVRERLLPAGDVVEHELRHIGVVADDDEHRRRQAAAPAPRRLPPSAR